MDRLPRGVRPVASAVLSLATALPTSRLDLLRLLLADQDFAAGRYDAARLRYAQIGRDPWRGVAALMTDWIDYKNGTYARGWPRYPGKGIPPGTRPGSPVAGPVRVREWDRPAELIRDLGLTRWDGAAPVTGRPWPARLPARNLPDPWS